mmetsp:Transcript_7468/g.18521  ORF Transcript_7468/g.18521 Transcript_7468/m.18521 type:complete len:232 (+) Transcript_7468:525-1220(+)
MHDERATRSDVSHGIVVRRHPSEGAPHGVRTVRGIEVTMKGSRTVLVPKPAVGGRALKVVEGDHRVLQISYHDDETTLSPLCVPRSTSFFLIVIITTDTTIEQSLGQIPPPEKVRTEVPRPRLIHQIPVDEISEGRIQFGPPVRHHTIVYPQRVGVLLLPRGIQRVRVGLAVPPRKHPVVAAFPLVQQPRQDVREPRRSHLHSAADDDVVVLQFEIAEQLRGAGVEPPWHG